MDFFAHQDNARRNTRLLVVFFSLAVFILVVLTNLAVAAFLFVGRDYNLYAGHREGMTGFLAYFSWERSGVIGLAITGAVALVVLFRWIQLSSGGKVVAEAMGGQRILPQTADPAERRCLNVVEEIALAANMPVPAVYVLEDERGINAFAAGIVPADAIIAVTRGAIDHFKRAELQGVIGHEFSHILNGDMRLNIRLAALLKGITFVGDVGYLLLRSSGRARSSRDKGGAALPILGLALCALGWLGGLIADFLRAAISRQREYLADASAVQFTRDREGIADALKVIGGYVPGTLVHAARASEMSHIFFGQVIHPLWQGFATHPPLDTRIQRLEPDWNGEYIKRKPRHYPNPTIDATQTATPGLDRAAIVAAAMTAAATAESTGDNADAEFVAEAADYEARTAAAADIPLALVRHSHEPLGAQAIVCALLLHARPEVYQAQMAIVTEQGPRGLAELAHTLYPAIAALGAPRRLPLVELCLPTLKAISPGQYAALKRVLLGLIKADAKTELFEWCLYQLLRHYLDPEFTQVRPSSPRYRRMGQVSQQAQVVLSILAHEGSGETADSFAAGREELELPGIALLPREECTVAGFSESVHELARLYPLLKPRLLKAMVAAASEDGELNPAEREILAAIAAVMDCPAPDLL
ncbi:M48 family metallopeptidase [Haliea sp. E17]|uniref:M48 family metallopeptidase n=1 Tax=Haliea sp. E17 TaxID=3401576 RepID=UPI003AB02ACC